MSPQNETTLHPFPLKEGGSYSTVTGPGRLGPEGLCSLRSPGGGETKAQLEGVGSQPCQGLKRLTQGSTAFGKAAWSAFLRCFRGLYTRFPYTFLALYQRGAYL